MAHGSGPAGAVVVAAPVVLAGVVALAELDVTALEVPTLPEVWDAVALTVLDLLPDPRELEVQATAVNSTRANAGRSRRLSTP